LRGICLRAESEGTLIVCVAVPKGKINTWATVSLFGHALLDVMLTLAANTPLVDGLAPDRGRIRKDFPYYGAPYTVEEQAGVTPMPRPAKFWHKIPPAWTRWTLPAPLSPLGVARARASTGLPEREPIEPDSGVNQVGH
jgi:hypothetical protein